MKSISAELKAHIRQEVTTLCMCMIITRRDRASFCFTDHDIAVQVDTQTYLPFNSFSRTSITHTSELEVDQLEIHGMLNSNAFVRADVASGLFDFAECQMFLVNYADATMGKLVARTGWLGEVIMDEDNTFSAELRGITQVFTYRLGVPYAPECTADLGDRFCKIGLSPGVWLPRNVYAAGDIVLGIIDAATGYVNAPLVNPSFETQTSGTLLRTATGWTTYGDVDGRWLFRTNLTDPVYHAAMPAAGSGSIFTTISDATSTHTALNLGMTQDFNLLASGLTTADLDTGLCRALFSYQAALLHVYGRVRGRLLAIDATGNTSTIFDSGLQSFAINRWFTVGTSTALLPVGTRTLRIDLFCIKDHIVGYGGALDGIKLSVNTPTGNLGGADQYGGVMFKAGNTGTSGATMPAFSNLLASTTVDNNITWTCLASFKEIDVVATVISNKMFTPTSLANPPGWYDAGLLIFETGANVGRAFDIKTWNGTTLELFLNAFYPIEAGDRYVIHPGCDKRLETCVEKFANALNFRGQPHVPGQDAYSRTPDAVTA